MKGIILAGGTGSRMLPLTAAVSKQLLPIYNKPMIYYPLSTLMLAGIRDVLVISTPTDLPRYRQLLGDGSALGLSIQYAEQERPAGVADAFRVGEAFFDGDSVCLILGDNIFHGDGLSRVLQDAAALERGAMVFAYHVHHPERYAVVTFDASGGVTAIDEKPASPRSSFVVPGLYFCDSQVARIAASLRPSARGELEIVDVLRSYLGEGRLRVRVLGRGTAWIDAGTPQSMLQASNFIATVEERHGLMIGAVEEVAFRMGFISADQLSALASSMHGTDYGAYLGQIAREAPR